MPPLAPAIGDPVGSGLCSGIETVRSRPDLVDGKEAALGDGGLQPRVNRGNGRNRVGGIVMPIEGDQGHRLPYVDLGEVGGNRCGASI